MPNLCDKESYDCNDLIKIVGILRSPEGCPWDRAQDHHTIRNNFLEEAYEAVEAIDLESSALLREELGDVLLQIALHSQMEAEQGHFDFNDVCTGICRKMIGRHPHIFGSEYAANAAEAAQSWEQQKRKEKGLYSLEDRLRQVSGALPALMRAQKLISRAAASGCFEDPNDGMLRNCLEDVLLADETDAQSWSRLLFLVCERMERLGISAEEALSRESDRMIECFLEMQHSEKPTEGRSL
jgi:mazG family protein